MTNELDPDLRRLFAATAESPQDEAFVAGVTATISRRPILGGLGIADALRAGAITAALAAGLGLVLNQVSGPVVALVSGSPFGWAAGLALVFAGAVCVRVLAPLARL